MAITLKCAHDNGSVSFPEETIESVEAPERLYEIVNGEVTLDGFDDAILRHDAQVLLSMPGDLYTMPTPAQQNKATKAKQQAATVEESAPVAQA